MNIRKHTCACSIYVCSVSPKGMYCGAPPLFSLAPTLYIYAEKHCFMNIVDRTSCTEGNTA